MIVGGKPLLHRQGGHVALVALVATTHREQGLFRIIEGETLVALRNDVQQNGGVKHLIVVAEVVAGNQIDACGLLQLPVLGALPICFNDLLQLTVLADARKTGDGSESGHESSI